MTSPFSLCVRPSVLRGFGTWLMLVALAAPVAAETAGVTPIVQMRPQATLPASSASELLNMLEQNRQEITELRGLVEQLTFEVQQLKKQSKERYVDLDRRLLELSEGRAVVPLTTAGSAVATSPQGGGSTGTSATPTSTVLPSAGSGSAAIVVPSSGDQDSGSAGLAASGELKQAYESAYQHIKDREYEKAVDALHAFINQYPESDLTPNAYYWLGEVYLVLPKLEQAKQAFIVVVSKYPGHRKAPDAFYKLGVTYDRLGNPREAETFLKQTVSRFPGTASANLAQEYLKKLK